MAYPITDLARDALRNGAVISYSVTASRGGVPLVGGQDLRPTGGSITDTTKPGVRRVLNLELAPTPGLFDLLAPVGTVLTVTATVRFTDRTTLSIPMGVFDVDSQKMSEGGGGLSMTAPDKWVRIQRARFLWPTGPEVGGLVTDVLVGLIRDALGPSEPVTVTATSMATTGALVWEKDRDKAIIDLAKGIGAWVYFDRNGVATIADIPTAGPSADWLVDASASGVMTELDRSRDRSNVYNVVVVTSTNADGASFPVQYVWDSDPASPTYAGTDPIHATGVGPFGIVPYFYDTPLPLDADGAINAGITILSRTAGLASQVSLGQVPNPAVDAFDVLDVLPPHLAPWTVVGYRGGDGFGRLPFGSGPFGGGVQGEPILERRSSGASLERHVVDTVTHSLSLGTAQHIDGRSTRVDDLS